MQMRKIRRKDRINTLKMLYANEVANIAICDLLSGKVSLPFLDEIDDYTYNLVNGTFKNKKSFDKLIDSVSINWKVSRMPIIDRCLLRQSLYEIMYIDTVPVSVSINEAVEIAKKFGGDDESYKFINGILGQISKNIDNADSSGE